MATYLNINKDLNLFFKLNVQVNEDEIITGLNDSAKGYVGTVPRDMLALFQ